MRLRLFFKALIIGGLALLLLIPLLMIEGQVEARNERQMEVNKDIANLTAGRQQLVGPLLVVSYLERITREEKLASGEVHHRTSWERSREVVVPRDLNLDGHAKVEARHRGLFKAQAYELDADLKGSFAVPARWGFHPDRMIQWENASLVVGLSDLRGIRKEPVLRLDGQEHRFQPGAGGLSMEHAIHVDLGPAQNLEGKVLPFVLPLALRGSQAFSVAPVAETTRVVLRSAWPSPSFQGRFSSANTVTEKGFEATWEVFKLARSLDRILEVKGETDEAFGVSFIEPVNVYLQSERAVKYGFLFVGLVFAAFFFFEMLKRLPIHPIQYLLVGFALAIFFLLLLSLSERLAFPLAYLLASGGCVALIGGYLAQVLGSPRRGWGFAGSLGLLFSVLYVLLASEDNALLMGSLVLFLGLGAVMLATRKVDWYALSNSPEQPV